MNTFNERDWDSNDDLVACRITPDSFRGLLRKHLTIPRYTRALYIDKKGTIKLLGEGLEVTGPGKIIFVKTSRFQIDITKKSLPTKEGYIADCSIILGFMAGETEFDLEQIMENLLKGRKQLYIQDIRSFLEETVEEIISSFISERRAVELCEMPVVEPLKEALQGGLKKLLYMGGLNLSDISSVEFKCPEFQMLKQEKSKIREREEVLRERSKLDELEMEKTLARLEALKAVGVDPNVALEIELGKSFQKGSRAKLLLVASGKGVTAYNPYSREPATPEEFFILPEKMGFARSTTIVENGNDHFIAIGAQRGIYIVSPRGVLSEEFFIDSGGRPRGGFNSIAFTGEYIYSSHSELGLVCWERSKPGETAKTVFRDITRKNKYTRGACFHNKTVYFSSGSNVYSFEPGGDELGAIYENKGSPITSLLVAGDSIFAGNQDGQVLHWQLEYPRQYAKTLLRRQGTIYSVSKMITDRGRFVAIGTRDYSATAFDPLTGTVRQYMSPDILRWVDGAGDFVFASSYSGHRIFIWDINHSARHLYSIPVDEIAQDLYVWEEEQ